jgi:hypothetical protein
MRALIDPRPNRPEEVFASIGRAYLRVSPFYQDIVIEGEILRARFDVLKVLEIRFGSEVAQQFRDRLDRIVILTRLSDLLKAAIKARNVDQFRRAFINLEG